MNNIEEITKYFPLNIYNLLTETFKQNAEILQTLQEIRIRSGRPIILKLRQVDILIQYNVSQTEIIQILEKICENSIYAYKNQICKGFITIKGGHRVGITGSAVVENGRVINMKYITSLNFRIAREILNCSNKVLSQIINIEDNSYILGFKEVYNFSGNKNPLSKIVTFDDDIFYLNTEGKIQKFKYKYDDGKTSSWDREYFNDTDFRNFEESGYMISKDGKIVLSEDGYIYTGEEIKNILNNKKLRKRK